MIDEELRALRTPVSSKRRMGDAILAMQMPAKKRFALRWPIGIGSAVVGIGAFIIITSLSTRSAYAGELRAIGLAQLQQKTRHQKSIIFNIANKPGLVMEFWRDGPREAYRQYDQQGRPWIVRVFDGKRKYHYESYNPSTGKEYASVEEDTEPDFGIENLNSILNGRMARDSKVIKKTGVKLGGLVCDYYSLDNGHYRYWVDPKTKLPVQREIYGEGESIWKRDTYDYPATFPADTFTPYKFGKIEYKFIVRGPAGPVQKAQTQGK